MTTMETTVYFAACFAILALCVWLVWRDKRKPIPQADPFKPSPCRHHYKKYRVFGNEKVYRCVKCRRMYGYSPLRGKWSTTS